MTTATAITTPANNAAVIADGVRTAERAHGAVSRVIRQVFDAEKMAASSTFAAAATLLLSTEAGDSADTCTRFYESFRRMTQNLLKTDCLLPPVFLRDPKTNEVRVVMLAPDATLADIRNAGLDEKSKNRAIAAYNAKHMTAEDKAAVDAEKATDKSATQAAGNDSAEPSAPVLTLEQLRQAVATLDVAALVTLGEMVNSELKARAKAAEQAAEIAGTKAAADRPSTMGDLPAEFDPVVPSLAFENGAPVPAADLAGNPVAGNQAKAKPVRKASA